MSYRYEYKVSQKVETLKIYKECALIYEDQYPDFSCLLDVIYDEQFGLNDIFVEFVIRFLTDYVKYLETDDYSLISPYMLIASTDKIYMGKTQFDEYITIRFTTSDIEKLIYFILIQIVNNKISIVECANCGLFFIKENDDDIYCSYTDECKSMNEEDDIDKLIKFKIKKAIIEEKHIKVFSEIVTRYETKKISQYELMSFLTLLYSKFFSVLKDEITVDEYLESVEKLASLKKFGGKSVL